MATSSASPRVAIVTGAAKGLGRAIALRLAHDGFDLSVNDVPACNAELSTLQEEIGKIGRRSFTHLGDVSVQQDVEMLVKDTARRLGKVDVMVANAGICITKPFLETTTQDWDRIFAINARGTFFCYKYAALQMIQQGGGGRIIGASSVAGKQAWGGIAAYSSTKWAIRGITQAAAQELGKYNITVNAFAPGPIETDMLADIGDRMGGGHETFYKKKHSLAALGTMAAPCDIASIVSFFASDDARRITGQTTIVDGGQIFD